MREIKFRAWDVFYQKFIKSDDNGMSMFWSKVQGGLDAKREVPVMQFIGFKDKNDREIYEGDIVEGFVKVPQLLTSQTDENSNTKMGGVIIYDYAGFRIKVIESLCEKDREGMVNYFDFLMQYEGDFDEIEVIGNIYATPELLS